MKVVYVVFAGNSMFEMRETLRVYLHVEAAVALATAKKLKGKGPADIQELILDERTFDIGPVAIGSRLTHDELPQTFKEDIEDSKKRERKTWAELLERARLRKRVCPSVQIQDLNKEYERDLHALERDLNDLWSSEDPQNVDSEEERLTFEKEGLKRRTRKKIRELNCGVPEEDIWAFFQD
jgi:hypothetical protein